MTCAEFRAWMEPLLDGELEVAAAATALDHLGRCATCSSHVDLEDRLRRALRRDLLAAPVPGGLRDWLRDRCSMPFAPLAMEALVSAAVALHREPRRQIPLEGLSEEEVARVFRDLAGYVPCRHHERAFRDSGLPRRLGGVSRAPGSGVPLCRIGYGDGPGRLSHVSLPRAEVGALRGGAESFPFRTFTGTGATVRVTDCITHVCAFVADDAPASDRIAAELARDWP